MFAKSIRLYGEYALVLKKYTKVSKEEESIPFSLVNGEDAKPQKAYIFETMYQCLITAAILGLINDRKEKESNNKTVDATVFGEMVVKNNSTFKIIYEQMILTDKNLLLSNDERIRKAFTPIEGDEYEKNEEEYFLSYVRGGLLIIDEMFSHCGSYEDLAYALSKIEFDYPLNSQN